MSYSRIPQLESLGFSRAGSYRTGQFLIEPRWKSREVVYVWTRGDEAEEILRVGIACGLNGFGARYASYNRWLDGRFKPDDAAEQKKSALFLSKLDDSCVVWARQANGKAQALQDERALRERLGPVLELDLMTNGWAKQEMRLWRADDGPRAPQSRSVEPRVQPPRRPGDQLVPDVTPALKAVFGDLNAALLGSGLTRSSTRDGWSYKQGHVRVCAIDPKPTIPSLRVFVGAEAERSAPATLRNDGRQRGWLDVRPKDRGLAVEYVSEVMKRQLRS